MVWKRLPTYLANLRLQLMPLAKEQLEQIKQTGWVKEAAFRTTPNVTKTEIKLFLEGVYGMRVERVSTINYEGKKKAFSTPKGKPYYYRRPDWKKAYVIFKEPLKQLPPLPQALRAEEAAQQQQQQPQQPQQP